MKKVLCIGDSNTYGYDPQSMMGGRYPENVRWTGLLSARGYTILNYGINGLTIPREASFAPYLGRIRSLRPYTVTVMLGTNDLLQGAFAEDAAARMEVFLEKIKEAASAASGSGTASGVMLIAPPPLKPGMWVDGPDVIEESVLLAELYREVSDKLGVSFADAGTWGIDLCFDGVHFSREGHAAFAEGLLKELE